MNNGEDNAVLRYFSGNGTPVITTANLNNVGAGDNDLLFDITYEVA